jgi:HSP20 family protein
VRYGTWQRSLPLPNDIDTSGAEAKFDRGVLTVKFPKVELEEEGPKRIELG